MKAAEGLLRRDVETAEKAVLRLIHVPLSDGQFSALVSFAFNLGAGTFAALDPAAESQLRGIRCRVGGVTAPGVGGGTEAEGIDAEKGGGSGTVQRLSTRVW